MNHYCVRFVREGSALAFHVDVPGPDTQSAVELAFSAALTANVSLKGVVAVMVEATVGIPVDVVAGYEELRALIHANTPAKPQNPANHALH